MNRRSYLQALSALFATATLGGCVSTTSDKEERRAAKADKASTINPNPAAGFDVPSIPEDNLNFYLVSDLGRNGYYEQKPIAELMGKLAEKIDIEFVVAAGDTHHFNGIASTQDPLWMTKQDYSKVSRRWIAPARYYTRTFEAGERESLEIFFIDTTPLIERYRGKDKYADAGKQSIEEQIKWLDKALAASKAKWKLVAGHHPLYAYTDKSESERTDMRKHVEALLNKYHVDMYLCGHIHNFQHIKPAGSKVEYLVNSSGSLARKVKETEGTVFCSSDAGFTLFSVNDNELSFFLMNGKGEIIYRYKITK